MVYLEGQWYEIGERYLEFLHTVINTLLATPSTVTLPAWSPSIHEESYNKLAAAQPGYLCLDQKFVKSKLHRRGQGFEACDLLGPNDELIHVKRADRSSLLSHLSPQLRAVRRRSTRLGASRCSQSAPPSRPPLPTSTYRRRSRPTA